MEGGGPARRGRRSGMIFRPYYRFETGCAAYLFGCATVGKCAVVDAHEEDADAYVAFAGQKGMAITHVVDTHVHADHRSGGPALARRVGARYCLHESARVALPFEPLRDEQEIELGNTRIKVLHTPGHTPESVCLVATDLRRGKDPWFVLTGDTLFVGAGVGMERSILPPMAEAEFGLRARAAVLSFIVVFGVSKAGTNYLAGRLSDRFSRKGVLVAGWLAAVPVPFMLMWAPSWSWVLAANALLGLSQGLCWSTTVIMKIDLAGSARRGLAMGLNEFAGYVAVAGAALATGFIAARYGFRPQPFYLGIAFVAAGLLLSALAVRDTTAHAALESRLLKDDG